MMVLIVAMGMVVSGGGTFIGGAADSDGDVAAADGDAGGGSGFPGGAAATGCGGDDNDGLSWLRSLLRAKQWNLIVILIFH